MDYKIFDSHIHPFWNQDERFGPDRYGGPETPDELVSELKRAGISKACGSVIKKISGQNFDEIRDLNNSALKLKDYLGEFYIPGIIIHPFFPEESCKEIDRMAKAGVKLIGELVPYFMGHNEYTESHGMEIFDYIQEKGMVVCVHPTNNEDMEKLLKNFPKLNIIFAHPGEKNDYIEHLSRMKRYQNAYLDLSGTGLFRNQLLRFGIDKVGSDRFILGTDFPICNPAMQVHGVLYEKLADAEYEAVLEAE